MLNATTLELDGATLRLSDASQVYGLSKAGMSALHVSFLTGGVWQSGGGRRGRVEGAGGGQVEGWPQAALYLLVAGTAPPAQPSLVPRNPAPPSVALTAPPLCHPLPADHPQALHHPAAPRAPPPRVLVCDLW